jgi:hypothetical protein
MALGHNDRAIEVLLDHIRRLPRSMPAAWLMLLDLYHQQGDRAEFRKLADTFHAHFNVRAPVWDEFADGGPVTGGIESFRRSRNRSSHCGASRTAALTSSDFSTTIARVGASGFPLATYSDILLLLQVLDAPEDVDIDEDLVAAGKLEARPEAASRAAARKPMPPEPAPRPAQQPIRFEIEAPQDTTDRKRH